MAEPHLVPVLKDANTIRSTILTNIVKMLIERKVLQAEKWLSNNSSLMTKLLQPQDVDYIVPLDSPLQNFKILHIKIIAQKISSLTQNPIITDYIKDTKNVYKIIILDDVTDKIANTLNSNIGIEVFKASFFMINIVDHVCSPKYEVLSEDDVRRFLLEYGLDLINLKKIYETDPICLYYGVKKGTILRIIRNSLLTGEACDYRLVVKKPVK